MSKSDEAAASMKNVLANSLSRAAEAPTSISAARPNHLLGASKSKNAMEIALDRIIPDPGQPRTEFDEDALQRLADSLRLRGQLQPIRVRWDSGVDRYVILTGERRFRAAALAGLPSLACVVHESPLSLGEQRAIQLVENCLREDLKPIEQAKAFLELKETNHWNNKELAENLSLQPSAISRALSLLDLPENVQEWVEEGRMAPSTAYEVAKLPREEDQLSAAAKVIEEGLSPGATAAMVREKRSTPTAKPRGSTSKRQNSAWAMKDFVFNEGTVVVRIKEGEADPDVVVILLEKALRSAVKAQRTKKGQRKADAA
jgi:ParB family chromosome partitioning protein